MSAPDPKAIAQVVDSLLAGAHQQQLQAAALLPDSPMLRRSIEGIQAGQPSAFWYAARHPLNEAHRGLLRLHGIEKPELVFIFEEYAFVECHFRRLFQAHEGPACCTDKARTVIAKLVRFYETGESVSFPTEGPTYHLPQRILRTHDAVVAFFEGLHRLYYGQPEHYLRSLAALAADSPQAPTSEP